MTDREPVSGLAFSVLGPMQVTRSSASVDVGGPKQRCLLGALLLASGRVVSVDRLIEILWGNEANERAPATLQVYIAKLRRSLEDDPRTSLATERPGYRLTIANDALDLDRFRLLTEQARQSMHADDLDRAVAQFDEALELVNGPLLADLADEPFVYLEAHAFERTLLTAKSDRLECELRRGRHAQALADLERMVGDHPFDERLYSLLMLALYRSGRQTDALEAYKRLKTSLRDELGVDPGPDVQDLELQILNHDPALSAPGSQIRIKEDTAPTVTRSTRTAPAAHLLLDGKSIELTRVVTTIGRLKDRTVVLADPDASRHHAEIRLTARGYVLFDIGSTNGTKVNGTRVSDHQLKSGDRIEIGDTSLLFEEAARPHRPI